MRRYAVMLEPVHDPEMEGYYYAHAPSLDLTTHGEGVDGALRAMRDLLEVWIAEKNAHGEHVPEGSEVLLGHVEIGDAVGP